MNEARTLGLLAVVFAAITTTAPPAHAGVWDTVGNTCVPIDDSIQADRYDVGAADVKLRTSIIGTATFMCPISEHKTAAGTWTDYTIYYNDGGSSTTVTVYLRELTMGSTSANTLYTCVSNDGSGSKNCNMTDITPSSSKFYWFEVQLTRTSGSSAAELLGISLH